MTTDGINIILTPDQKCKKYAENDRLGIFQKPPCELRDADPDALDLTDNLDAIQIAAISLDHGDELIAENLLQDIDYEDYLAERDRLVALVNAGLCGQ